MLSIHEFFQCILFKYLDMIIILEWLDNFKAWIYLLIYLAHSCWVCLSPASARIYCRGVHECLCVNLETTAKISLQTCSSSSWRAIATNTASPVYLIDRVITYVDYASHMWSHVWPFSKRQLYSPTCVACCRCHLWFIAIHQAALIASVSWGLTASTPFLLNGSFTDGLKLKASVYLVSVEAFILFI